MMAETTLKDVLNLEELSKVFRDFSVTTSLAVSLFDADGKLVIAENRCGHTICEKARGSEQYAAKCRTSVKYGGEKSLELGEPYMYSCECGLIMCSVPVGVGSKVLGSIACGPLMLWEVDDVAVDEFFKKAAPLFQNTAEAEAELRCIMQLQCVNLTSAAHLLYIIVSYMLRTQDEYMKSRHKITEQQDEIANMLLEKKLSAKNVEIYEQSMKLSKYPIHLEKELIAYVQMGDGVSGKRILNNLLSEIFSLTAGNLDAIKARLIELVAILSRAAVDSGAPLEALTESTSKYMSLLMGESDFEEVCFATGETLDSFMVTVYRFRQQKKNSVHLANAIGYIKSNYGGEISLDNVASSIYVSSYYLSHLFRDEMDMTFSDYVLGVRMEKAKELLKNSQLPIKDVCFEVGFNDANYFAKAFKKAYGISPKNYRGFCK